MVALSPVDNSNLPGTTTDDLALPGNLGEVISSVIATGSAVSLTTTVTADIASIVLTPGDWDVWGSVTFKHVATTTVDAVQASIGSTSATTDPTGGRYAAAPMFGLVPATYTALSVLSVPQFPLRVLTGTTTTLYLVAQATFGVSTMSVYGAIYARRRR